MLVLLLIIPIAFAQDHDLSRDITPNMKLNTQKAYSLDFFNGLSFPQGELNDFVKDGFNSGILIHKNFYKKLSIGFSANHSRFNHRQSFGSMQGSSHKEMRATSFDIGPQYSLTLGKIAVEFYGRSGLSIVNSPELLVMYPQTDITITNLNEYKSTALMTRLGANMTAQICQGLNLYFSSEYSTSLNSNLDYQTRDLSKAFRADGSFDPDLASGLPYKNESLSLSMLNVNFGVRIVLGSNGIRRSSTPIYHDFSMVADYPMYKRRFYQFDEDYLNSGCRAQDYNSNRSYNSSVNAPDSNDAGSNGSGKAATDNKSKGYINSTAIDTTSTGARDESKAQDDKLSRNKQKKTSKVTDIARNSGGRHGEGRLPTDYTSILSKDTTSSPVTDIARNSSGRHGEGRLPTDYTSILSKETTSSRVTDIARNSGGRHGEGSRATVNKSNVNTNSIVPDTTSTGTRDESKAQDVKLNRNKQKKISKITDIARNSGGRHGEGRLPTDYTSILSKETKSSRVTDIARNSSGRHGEGRFPTAYTSILSKETKSSRVTDIARNSGGRHGEGSCATVNKSNVNTNSIVTDTTSTGARDESKAQDVKLNRIKQKKTSKVTDIARNSGGRHGEGRLPTDYTSILSKETKSSRVTNIARNSGGRQGEGRLPTAYTSILSKETTSYRVTDIARNSGGRHSEGRFATDDNESRCDNTSVIDSPDEMSLIKSKTQLAKERRQKRRAERKKK